MANRLKHKPWSMVREETRLYGRITFGSSGAITSFSGRGVTGVTKDSAGTFTIQLEDKWNSVVHATFTFFGDGIARTVQLLSDDVNGARTVTMITVAGSSPTDPNDGNIISFELVLKDTNARD